MANREIDVNLASDLKNPGGTFKVTAHDREFPTESFTDSEAKLFERQFNSYIAALDSSMMSQIFKMNEETISMAASFAKQELDGKVFGGINAGDNQIGFDILRPGQIRADPDSGDAENDWYFEPDSSGWNDWIGDGSSNNYTVGEDQVSVIFAFMDQDVSTEISGINVEQFGRNMDMLPHDLNDVRVMDNDSEVMVQPLPTLLAQDNDDVHIKLRHDRATESQPRLLGLSFALGSFLNNEDY